MLKKHSRAIAAVASGVVVLGTGLWFTPIGEGFRQALGIYPAGSFAPVDLNTLIQSPGYESFAPLLSQAQSNQGLESDRARYRLAAALLEKDQGAAALQLLKDLERSYPVLTTQIQVKRALAYEQIGDRSTAIKNWQDLVKQSGDNPASVEALYHLGKQDPKFWETAIAKFPAHPRTLEIATERLTRKNSPTAMADLLLIARHGLYREDYGTVLAKLVGQYPKQLKAEDWDAIAFGYWEHQDYLRAAKAYAQGSSIPRNLYRVGRGFQLGQQGEPDKKKAIQAYQTLVSTFPKADESGLALRRLAQLVEPNQRLPYLDRAIKNFPKEAPTALLQKVEWADFAHNLPVSKSAAAQLLNQFGKTDPAADYRWRQAKATAKTGDRKTAITWAQQVISQNPESEFAPEALFWLGKWTEALSKKPKAGNLIFQQVIQRYPSSYYAWRSASHLGWPVGDFKTVRKLHTCAEANCGVTEIPQPALTVSSEALRELYTIGQFQEAWDLWQVEFQNPVEPSVNEEYTDGLLRQSMGEYLDGIFMVTFLDQRENPDERSQVRTLKQSKDYSYALYPLPFWDLISELSTTNQVNPWLVVGLMRQESRFQPKIRSSTGAMGLMQVMPETGDWIANKIKQKTFNLESPSDNIKFGTWYLGYTHDEYQNNSMLAVASYNAGPGAVKDWVKRFGSLKDLDQFVEAIPYDETRKYVKAVFENYWNYLRLYNPEVRKKLSS